MRIAIALVLHAGCLLAPERPIDVLDSEGCVSPGTELGLTAVASTQTHGPDTVIRVGLRGGQWRLYFYSATRTSTRCPDDVVLIDDGSEVTAIDAIQPAEVEGFLLPHLLVLATHADGSSSVRHLEAAVDGTFVEVGRVEAPSFQVKSRTTDQGSDRPGFIGFRKALSPERDELWFGGGSAEIAVADVTDGFAGEAQVVAVEPEQAWYFAAPLKAGTGGDTFALIGDATTVAAQRTGATIATTAVMPRSDGCALPACSAGRLAARLIVPVGFGGNATPDGFSINRATGQAESVRSSGDEPGPAPLMHDPLAPVSGDLLDSFVTLDLDAFAVWRTATGTELVAHANFLDRPNVNTPATPPFARIPLGVGLDRVVAMMTDDGYRVLVLASDPRSTVEQCFFKRFGVAELMPCE